MMIFDGFPDMPEASMFAAYVAAMYGRYVTLIPTVAQAQALDPFPGVLTAPIVHVERLNDESGEAAIERAVGSFGGSVAGT